MAEFKKTPSVNLLQFMLLISAMGMVLFILTSSTFSFKDAILGGIYKKPKIMAGEVGPQSNVSLMIKHQGKEYRGALNVPLTNSQYDLVWKTQGQINSCVGRVWGLSDMDEAFKGVKDPNGGNFITKNLSKNNPYVYSIDCKDNKGDVFGDSVTINVGAQGFGVNGPYLTDVKTVISGIEFKGSSPVSTEIGSDIQIVWSSFNTKTPYSVCIATGTWPSVYKDLGNSTIYESFEMNEAKIYTYRIYCSNENSFTEENFAFFVQ